MSYLVVCTFDLANATSDDYENAYADLKQNWLHGQVKSSKGNNITLPTTTTAGEVNGQSAGSVRNGVTERVKKAFAARIQLRELRFGGWRLARRGATAPHSFAGSAGRRIGIAREAWRQSDQLLPYLVPVERCRSGKTAEQPGLA